jgi:hypothetical protein
MVVILNFTLGRLSSEVDGAENEWWQRCGVESCAATSHLPSSMHQAGSGSTRVVRFDGRLTIRTCRPSWHVMVEPVEARASRRSSRSSLG